MHRTAPAARLLALAASLALVPAGAAGQDPQPSPPPRAEAPAPPTPGEMGPLLDAPISRTEYQLGPGDQLDLAIFGEMSAAYTLTVTPEGSLLVPTAGIARVLGLNIDQAEDRVRALVGRYYRNVDVRLALSRVRTFKVFLAGDVADPGVRVATAATRVSEVVSGQRGTDGVRRRNVSLRRATGETLDVDMARFHQLGDVTANPTLREGDAVLVPTVDERVMVNGRVHFPGDYEFRRGESLAELLTIANGGGGFPASAADTVRLVRLAAGGERTTYVLPRAEAEGARGRAMLLQPFDAIYVAEVGNFGVQYVAEVRGQVVFPGRYPVRPDTTTVRDLIEMAGGFTPQASIAQATLRRARPERGAPRDTTTELDAIPPELLTRDERRILQTRQQADATLVVVDFHRIFAAGRNAYDIPVRNGDVLAVPRRAADVVVVGAVRTPGVVPHVPGQGVSYFIREAGGYTRRADRTDVVVIKASTGARMSWREAGSLDAGDTVVIPFREERTWTETLTTVHGIVGTISGLILTIITLKEVL